MVCESKILRVLRGYIGRNDGLVVCAILCCYEVNILTPKALRVILGVFFVRKFGKEVKDG